MCKFWLLLTSAWPIFERIIATLTNNFWCSFAGKIVHVLKQQTVKSEMLPGHFRMRRDASLLRLFWQKPFSSTRFQSCITPWGNLPREWEEPGNKSRSKLGGQILHSLRTLSSLRLWLTVCIFLGASFSTEEKLLFAHLLSCSTASAPKHTHWNYLIPRYFYRHLKWLLLLLGNTCN